MSSALARRGLESGSVAGLQPLAAVGLRNKTILVGPPSSSSAGQQRRWNKKKGGKRETEEGEKKRGEKRKKRRRGRRRPREVQTHLMHEFRPNRLLLVDTMPPPSLSVSIHSLHSM